MGSNTILIAGASGVVGRAALRHFAAAGDWSVIGLSRRRPELAEPFRHLSLDLRDAEACARAVGELAGVTHLVFAALHEQPGLVAGWRESQQMRTNEAMLRNLLDALEQARNLRHVTLLQGTKAYGAHLRPIAVPARERWPRNDHPNFYWLQEDLLRTRAAKHEFDFTIWRPQVIFGDALGVAMNVIPVIGAYAAICREEGRPFAFPGGPAYVLEAVDARLLARAIAWGASTEAARNETFNITNGDVFAWPNVWPAIADALGMLQAPPEPFSLAEFLPGKAEVWDRIVKKHNLLPLKLADMLGESHHYADYLFALGAKSTPSPKIVSTIKLRRAGFGDCIDTEDMFRDWFAILQHGRVLPPRD